MDNIKPIEYFAGHFDGEGCVYFKKSGKGYRLQTSVTNAYLPILVKYKKAFGGNIYNQKSNKNNKPLFRWQLGSQQEQLEFLTRILPFLEEKREQAEMGKHFLEMRILENNASHPSDSIRILGKNLYEKCRIAKKHRFVLN